MKTSFYILIICIMLPFAGLSQVEEKIDQAYTLYTKREYREAAKYIDEAAESKKGIDNELVWHIRGFIYKDIYLKEDLTYKSKAREEAVLSFRKSVTLDEDGNLYEQNKLALTTLARSYYNDAVEIIDERNPLITESANDFYQGYKDITLFMYPDSSLKARDIEFYLAMSTAYRKIYTQNREENEDELEKSREYLRKVLDLDPENFSALYSMSVSYYNTGAKNFEKLDDAELHDIFEIEAESLRSIEIALPYMLKAYAINPEKIEAIKGLRIIYFNLHKEEESLEMKQKEERLENQFKN